MADRPQRTPLERLLLRWPRGFRALADAVFRLPPGTRARTALVRAVVDRSYAALERRDFELVRELLYLPDVVLRFADDPGPDYQREYRGRDASFDVYERWLSEWGGFRREPVGFLDRGEVLVVLGRERVRGAGSGLEVDRELGQVFRLRGARVAEQTEFRSWDGALAAAAAAH